MAELFAQGDDVPPAARPVSIPLRAGDIACFSSFCPHMTLPNTREGYVRKGYILQYLAVSRAIIAGIWGAFFQECQR